MISSIKISVRVFAGLLAAVILSLAAPSSAAPTAPLLKNAEYRPTEDVIATAPGITITQGDLYRYMVLTGVGDVRDVIGWKKLTDPQKLVLQGITELIIYTELIAPKYQGPATAEDVSLETKGEEIMALPAARLLWGDKIARRSVRIFPEDIAYHFQQNPALYSDPETVVVRRLRVPTPSPVTLEVRNDALIRAQEIRERAIREGGLAPIMAKDASLLVDPPGTTISLTKTMPGIDTQILDEAFTLTVSQISRPIQTPAGFFLLEVVSHNPAEPYDPEKVTTEIKVDLERLLLAQQFDYIMLKKYIESYPIDRSRLYEFMSGDTELVYVDNFSLTVDEFNKLYPDVIGDPSIPNLVAISAQTYEILTGEIALKGLAKEGLLNDPFYSQSQQMATKIFRTTQYGRIKKAEIEPTEDELKAYIATQPVELQPGNAKTVWSLKINPRRTGDFNQSQLDTLQILMQNYMTSAVRDAKERLTKAREKLEEGELLDPDQALRGISQPSDPRVRLRAQAAGEYTKFDSQAILGIKYESLLLDEFTPTLPLRDGSVVSYFVVSEKPLEELPKEQLMTAARMLYVNNMAFKEEIETVKRWKDDGSIRFVKELQTTPSPNAIRAPDSETTSTLKASRPAPALVQ